MLEALKNYRPDEIDFVLSDEVKERFADVLTIFEGAENVEDVIKKVNEYFNAEFPNKEVARRYIDEFEKRNIREEYCQVVEEELPDAEKELLDAIDQAKRIKKEAEDSLLAVRNRIKELAARVSDGKEDFKLSAKNTFKIAIAGHYLYYSWVDGKVKLVKAETVPAWDKDKLWAQEDRNRIGFKELFGIEFPEIEKPAHSDNEEDSDEDFDDHDGDPDDFANDDYTDEE